jgi:hypothetical protein
VVVSVTAAGQTILVDRRCVNNQGVVRALGEFSLAEQRQLVVAIPLLEKLAQRL